MSILFKRDVGSTSVDNLIPNRTLNSQIGSVNVTADSALRMSAVWACLRLRANMCSSAPLNVFRTRAGGLMDDITSPPVLTTPDGDDLFTWLWSSQLELDRYGNCFGIITARDGLGLPFRIQLLDTSTVAVITKGGLITGYRINGTRYDPADIWHETQYKPAGFPLGLSPIAYAAWSIGGYLSAQQFALNWFGAGAQPAGVLKNTEEDQLPIQTREEAKRRFRESTRDGDIFVTGMDWEWTPSTTTSATAGFLDEMQYGLGDICRFFDVPGDLIGAVTASGAITYASISQRMVELLVTSLGPMYHRRQTALSHVLPARQFCTFDTNYLLRLDPATLSAVENNQVMARIIAPSEVRASMNKPPFTPEQIAEFDTLAVPLPKAPKGLPV